MTDKRAAEILIRLRDKYPLTKEEQEALSKAIGILGWTTFAENRLKGLGERRRKRNE